MTIQELQTLKTLGTNVVIVVLNNSGYLSIRQTHENFFGTIVGATPESGVEFPDFSKVAEAYGIPAYTISSKSELSTVKNLMDRKGPLLLDIKVDSKQNFRPRMKARLDENGKFIPQFLDDMFPFLDASEVNAVRESAKKL
jgi:acetolactate synthase-1/2/3 large subunit